MQREHPEHDDIAGMEVGAQQATVARRREAQSIVLQMARPFRVAVYVVAGELLGQIGEPVCALDDDQRAIACGHVAERDPRCQHAGGPAVHVDVIEMQRTRAAGRNRAQPDEVEGPDGLIQQCGHNLGQTVAMGDPTQRRQLGNSAPEGVEVADSRAIAGAAGHALHCRLAHLADRRRRSRTARRAASTASRSSAPRSST